MLEWLPKCNNRLTLKEVNETEHKNAQQVSQCGKENLLMMEKFMNEINKIK